MLSASPIPNAEENTTWSDWLIFAVVQEVGKITTSGDVVSAKMHMELSRAAKMILIDIQSKSNILLGQS